MLPLFTKTHWKVHINLFIQIPLTKCIIRIHLTERPIMHSSNTNNSTNSNLLGDWRKSLLKIESCSLPKTLTNKPGFKPLNRAIRLIFYSINPFATNGDLALRQRHYLPCVVFFQSPNFLFHSINPSRIQNSFLISLRFQQQQKY